MEKYYKSEKYQANKRKYQDRANAKAREKYRQLKEARKPK